MGSSSRRLGKGSKSRTRRGSIKEKPPATNVRKRSDAKKLSALSGTALVQAHTNAILKAIRQREELNHMPKLMVPEHMWGLVRWEGRPWNMFCATLSITPSPPPIPPPFASQQRALRTARTKGQGKVSTPSPDSTTRTMSIASMCHVYWKVHKRASC
jgi:hypothetical protein